MTIVNEVYGYLLWRIICVCLIAMLFQTISQTSEGLCAELRPYELPSQKVIPYQQQRTPYPQKSKALEFDYEEFAERASKLNVDEKAILEKGLEERLNNSQQQGSKTEARHYERLLEAVKNSQ